MLAFIAKARKAVLAGVFAGSGAYAALAGVPGLSPYVQLGAAIVAGVIGGAVVWFTPNASDPAALQGSGPVPASGIKPPAA